MGPVFWQPLPAWGSYYSWSLFPILPGFQPFLNVLWGKKNKSSPCNDLGGLGCHHCWG